MHWHQVAYIETNHASGCSTRHDWTCQTREKDMRQGQIEQLVHLGRPVALKTRGQFEYRHQITCYSRIVAALSADVDGVELAFNKRRRSSLMFLVVKSPKHHKQLESECQSDSNILGFRSVMTTPQRSSNSLSFFKSKSRSVVPD